MSVCLPVCLPVCLCADLEQVAVHRLPVQRGVDIDLPVSVVHRPDLKHILHVPRHQGEVHLAEGEREREGGIERERRERGQKDRKSLAEGKAK